MLLGKADGAGGGKVPDVAMLPEDAHDIVAQRAREAVRQVLQRAEYEALKLLAWRFPFGSHIIAVSRERGDQHAVYISSEEVIYKARTGEVVSDTWLAFLEKYPQWRVATWPMDTTHADSIVQRARAQVGEQGCNELASNSEHFVSECYAGGSSCSEAFKSTATVAALAAGGGAATGYAAAIPYATSSVTVYAFSLIPVGTATVVSGGVLAVGAAAGAAVGGAVAAPLYRSLQRKAREASMLRLPFCIINETHKELYVRTYDVADTLRLLPVCGMSGVSEGDIPAGQLLELDPANDGEEFRIGVSQSASYFTKESLSVIARRGSVYILRFGEGEQTLALSRVPRTVLPAYAPG